MSFVKPRHQVMRLYGNVDDPDVYGPESFPVGGDFIIVATELPMTTPGSVTVPSATPSLNFNLPAGSSLAASIGGQAIALGNETTAFGSTALIAV